MGKTNKTPEFLKKFPLGKVPAADTPDGPIFESNAILRYIARVGTHAGELLGSTPYEQSVVDQWNEFTACYVAPNVGPLFYWKFGYGTFSQEKFDAAKQALAGAFTNLERHLENSGNKFLTGGHLTVADIILASTICNPLKISLDKGNFGVCLTQEFMKPFPKVQGYFDTVFSHDHVKKVIGEVPIQDKFVPPQ